MNVQRILAQPPHLSLFFPDGGSCRHSIAYPSTAESNGKSSNGSKTISEGKRGRKRSSLGLCTHPPAPAPSSLHPRRSFIIAAAPEAMRRTEDEKKGRGECLDRLPTSKKDGEEKERPFLA